MGKPSSTRLIDVANHVGLSRPAVARVLLGTGEGRIRVSEENAERIRAAAKELNYQPNLAAQQLKGKGSRTIAAVAINSAPAVMMNRICAMEERAWHHGYDLVLCRTPYLTSDRMQKFITRLKHRDVEGLVVLDRVSQVQYDEDTNKELKDFTSVFYGYAVASDEEKGVQPNVAHGTQLATQHLIDQQYTRIGLATMRDTSDRGGVWKRTIQEAKLDFQPEYHFQLQDTKEQRLSYEGASALVDTLIDKQRCNALVLENDYWAARVLQVLHDRGISVPDDVALVGYNNLDFTEFTSPQLTTVDENDQQIGYALVDKLVHAIRGEPSTDQPRIDLIEPTLIHRQSS